MPKTKDVRFDLSAQNKTGAAFAQVDKGLAKLDRSVAQLGSRLVGVVGATGLALFVKRSVESAASLNQVSRRLNVSVESLSRFGFAAEQSGISTNTMTLALQRMTRRVAEAAVGTGEAQGALRELGVDAAALAKLSPDAQFRRIAKALSQVGDQGDKVRLAMKVFDSEGVSVLQFTDSLAALEAQAVKTGNVISTETARNAEEISSNIAALTGGLEAFAAKSVSAFVTAVKNIKRFGAELVTGRKVLPQTIEEADARIAKLEASIVSVSDRLLGLIEVQPDGVFTGLEREIEQLQREKNAIIELRDAIADLSAPTTAPATVTPLLSKAGELEAQRLAQRQAANAKLEAAERHAAARRLDILSDEGQTAEGLIKVRLARQLTELEQIAETLGAGSVIQVNQVAAGLARSASEQLEALKQKTSETTASLRSNFETSFFALFDDGVAGMVRTFSAGLARMAAQAAASGIFDLLAGAIGASFGSGATSSGGSSSSGFPTFAHGGAFTVGGAASAGSDNKLVAFRATPGERVSISPPGVGGGGGGGVTVVNNVNVTGGPDLVAELPRILAAQRRRTLAEFRDAHARGLVPA